MITTLDSINWLNYLIWVK